MKKKLLLALLLLIVSGCSYGTYESMTAEEWADDAYYYEDRYNEFRSCVEDYDNFSESQKRSYGGIFYYCE